MAEPPEPDDELAPDGYVLTDELDLHGFLPRECADATEEYVRACHEAGMTIVRIIHGKGTGAMRRTVHAVLARHPLVERFALDAGRGGWGATTVWLAARAPAS
jgi:DNA-nicking Smr family endonuclease